MGDEEWRNMCWVDQNPSKRQVRAAVGGSRVKLSDLD